MFSWILFQMVIFLIDISLYRIVDYSSYFHYIWSLRILLFAVLLGFIYKKENIIWANIASWIAIPLFYITLPYILRISSESVYGPILILGIFGQIAAITGTLIAILLRKLMINAKL